MTSSSWMISRCIFLRPTLSRHQTLPCGAFRLSKTGRGSLWPDKVRAWSSRKTRPAIPSHTAECWRRQLFRCSKCAVPRENIPAFGQRQQASNRSKLRRQTRTTCKVSCSLHCTIDLRTTTTSPDKPLAREGWVGWVGRGSSGAPDG